MKKFLVIGAGFSGTVIARELAEAGHEVHIVDGRNHIGGNAYDLRDEKTGIRYHKYGPHIFHTSNERVWNWLSKFTEWHDYKHQVYAMDNRFYYDFPPNINTCDMFKKDRNAMIDLFFRPYTRKMWGMELEEIDPRVINRVPIDPDKLDNYYFKDKYQGMPKGGYTALFEQILDHPNIKLMLNMQVSTTLGIASQYDHIFNSAPIDAWYDYMYGELPYRSIKFHTSWEKIYALHGISVTNFTDDDIYTRVTEWKYFPGSGGKDDYTLLTYEEPCDYKDNNYERYYPVKDVDGKNRKLYKKYADLDHGNMTFIGRCGQYVYIDMDQAVNSALQIAEKFK